MNRQFDPDLDRVRQMLLEMAGKVEAMIADASRALAERDDARAAGVIGADREVDALEIAIDELCLEILALHEPKAGDFRFLVAVQKIIGDLERMGDSAVNMAQSVQRLVAEPPLAPSVDVPRLSAQVRAMVRDALDAFVGKNAALARAVCDADQQVDDLYHHQFGQLVAAMKASPANVERALHLLLLARNLERIADHATNIAEDVVYYLEAIDIRHAAKLGTAGTG